MPRRKKITLLSDVTIPKDYSMRKDPKAREYGITQSLLSHFPLCRQRFLLKINRWRLKNNDYPVVFGNLCHDVLEKAYKRKKFPTRKILVKLIDQSCEYWEDKLSAYSLQELPSLAKKAEAVLWEYFKFYRTDFKKIKFVELERTFEVDFEGYILRGKKDGILKDPSRRLFEHKTKGRWNEEFLQAVLNFDFQNLFYITADEAESKTGEKMFKVLYNVIRNPGLRQGQKESFKEYMDRITADIKTRPDYYFRRYPVTYLAKDKASFKNELRAKLDEAEKFLKGELPLYKNQGACEIPYRCEFLGACGSGNLNGYEQGPTLFPEL